MLCALLAPAQQPALLASLAARGAGAALALDAVPRTLSRCQAFDALSSQANVAGYRAVVEAAHEYGRMFAPQSACCMGGGAGGLYGEGREFPPVSCFNALAAQ